MTIAAGTKLGRYEIRSQLGAGGMGEVYRAYDPKMNREIAIKILPAAFSADKERLARFEQEAQAAGSLNHPNILVIYHIDTHDGSPYIVTELLEGETLRQRIGGVTLPQRRAIDYALGIAHGLAAAHEKGIVHRDLKPANVKLTGDGQVKLLDFGLAKALDKPVPAGNPSISPTLTIDSTRLGFILGTAAYMAPEQARGGVVDKRVDIWAFGCVIYDIPHHA